MNQRNSSEEAWSYSAHEAVGVFADPDAVEAVIGELEVSGFDRATISVLATDRTVKERVGHLYHSVADMEDNGQVPQSAFVSKDSLTEGAAFAVGVPFYIGGTAGAVAVIATGGALAAAIAVALAGGAACAGLGALLASAVARHHKEHVLEQLTQGGLVIWVSLRDDEAKQRALQIFTKAGGRDVHVHEVQREWTLKDRPLSTVQFDPFLQHDDAG
ncbi:MAG: hypothetical protein KGK01_04185 [Bradyrhizobium sp.]|uniref:hypothetical protein n=1 Tax=Bradyrhizobium sp. TaxID=376 RepID=UPI001C296919|nr:hypothetical protein [Bradyrhizobium sp.]MBU6463397.1 hypothetical protein [Pseudomonadota bacterium]MDE2067454.1 hypothetical protein [Bradyrhizobium sp.]MDE2241658.1 hypothetical protein [Bradyrhizobium sp.]MDE2471556.1 hypothetical protein [Bradyrhizobium sp.]